MDFFSEVFLAQFLEEGGILNAKKKLPEREA
jgi:hypothetical protein